MFHLHPLLDPPGSSQTHWVDLYVGDHPDCTGAACQGDLFWGDGTALAVSGFSIQLGSGADSRSLTKRILNHCIDKKYVHGLNYMEVK